MTMRSFGRWRQWIFDALFMSLLALAPLTTGYIFYRQNFLDFGFEPDGGVRGVLFATQLLAVATVIAGVVARRRPGPLGRPVRSAVRLSFLLTVVVGLSAYLSSFPDSFVQATWLLLGCLLAWSVSVSFRRPMRAAAAALSVGGVMQFVLALSQFSLQRVVANKWLGVAEHLPEISGSSVVETLGGRWLRAYGTLPHPNMLGAYLAIAALASLFLLVSTNDRRWRLLAGLGAAVNILGMGLTFSRSALIGFLVGLVVLVVGQSVVGGRAGRRSALLSVGLSLVALVAVLGLLHQPFLARVTATGRLERISVESRLEQYGEAWRLVRLHPWFGVGPGLMPQVMALVLATHRNPWDYQPVHNLPLLVLAEAGLVGLLVWLSLIVSLLRRAGRSVFRRTNLESLLPLVLLAVLLTVGLFDHFVWSSWFGQLLFWATVGLTVARAEVVSPAKS